MYGAWSVKINLKKPMKFLILSKNVESFGKLSLFYWKVILILMLLGNTQGNLLRSAGSSISVQMVCLYHFNMLDF